VRFRERCIVSEIRCYRGFTAFVHFDPDEQVLHGRVEAIRDVVTFQASSVEEVQTTFEEPSTTI